MSKLILDYVYDHERNLADQVFLTQPVNNVGAVDFTWKQLMDQARRMAAHLQSLGFEPNSRVAILSRNTAHFMMAELAIWMAGHTTVAIFPTETAATVNYVLDHSGARLLFVGKLDGFDRQAEGIPAGLPCIALPLAPKTDYARWDDIVAVTPPMAGRPFRKPDDLMFILYTSGTTGTPKGVMHSFERGTRASECIAAYQDDQMGPGIDHRFLSYLPLAHIFERAWIECANFVRGRSHIYFTESLESFVQDLKRARPTSFISVPRLWLKFQQGALAKLPERKLRRLLAIPVLRTAVRRKVLEGLGLDQVVLAGSGSAPIAPSLLAWYRRLGLNLQEGLGMTEDFACSHSTDKTHNLPGYVGIPLPGVERRIDQTGELLIKSPGTFVGYYKRPDLDAESFTSDGFFRTGDLAEIGPGGQLRLTGRKKELFKTAKGKYVAPAPIENLINESPMVEQSLVAGVGQVAAHAIVVPAEGIRGTLDQAERRAEFEREMAAILARVNAKVPDYERLRMIVVERQPWTIDNGCLTPTLKLKRPVVEGRYAPFIDTWANAGKSLVWHDLPPDAEAGRRA